MTKTKPKPKLLTVGPKGQVVIPAELREELGIKPGDKVQAVREGNSVKITSHRAVIEGQMGAYAHIPVSLSQELHDERREEAEAKGW
ncbi:MAG TPA: AbrB/MazE/SpoVT family DNA-binding domain-containing protein [Meiothermus sp.]|jgi:AbrB family looped-hinge helix DNA binding protein|nr:AbrB/MazE/SpoVT family DNA-binding domain-containing protein [Meiothermus sp.]